MSEVLNFEFVVIGGGSAGYAAARTARETTDSVAIIDSATELGGLCILRGCMPSKTLIYAAEVLHLARNGSKFGLTIPSAKVDMKALNAHKRFMIDDFKSYRQEQLQSDRFQLFRERAVFIDPETIEIQPSGRRIRSRHFLIGTGSLVNWPSIPGMDLEGIWTSDDVLDLDFLPESVIVLGGGVVACELAQFLNRAGSRVIQIQRSPRILKDLDPRASITIEKVFREEGIELFTETDLLEIRKNGENFVVKFNHESTLIERSAPYLLNTFGRRPATDGLNLPAAGVALADSGHIRVNSVQQSTNPKIYAAGDVVGPLEIVHLAILQAETAARHARTGSADPVNYDHRTAIYFTDPQIATAGIPLAEAKERFPDVRVADYPFDDHGKSLLMHATHGYVQIWADAESRRILGATCVGKDAGELIHAMAVGVSLNATPKDLLKTHWYHPTLSEIWSYPLEDLADELG